MHILLTGASGRIGRRTLDLLSKSGHSITALDLHRPKIPLPQTAAPTQFHQIDLTDFKALEKVFEKASESSNPVDAIVHLGAIPDPTKLDDRVVHNNNVTSNYNVLKTSMNFGVKRIVQASSVNATGLSYTIPEHLKFDMLPLNEESPKRPEDGYSISKEINEMQADGVVRRHPGSRIASLRFHMARNNYEDSWPDCQWRELWSWVSYESCARACLLGLTSQGWEGHEVFNIVAPEICREGPLDGPDPWGRERAKPTNPKPEALALLEKYWPGTKVDAKYWKENTRRAFWDTSKAERLLGWKHDE